MLRRGNIGKIECTGRIPWCSMEWASVHSGQTSCNLGMYLGMGEGSQIFDEVYRAEAAVPVSSWALNILHQ